MSRMRSPFKSILLNLPVDMANRLDEAASVLRMSRSDLIRRAVTRDLQFIVLHELERTLEHQRQTEKVYGIWSSSESSHVAADFLKTLA